MTVWETAPLVVGHRGGRGEGWPPENTLPAFEQARAEGALAIELDVRGSSDGEAVVFHDETLERMTGGRDARRVAEVPWRTLSAIDVGGAKVPVLEDVLAWASRHGVAVNVELKHGVPRRCPLVRACARAVRRCGGDILFSSFDPVLLAMAAAASPRVPRALLTYARQAAWADGLQEAVRPPIVRALHLERVQVGGRQLARFARRGLRLGAWTVNDPAEARELVQLGVASIITDAPGAILAAIAGA